MDAQHVQEKIMAIVGLTLGCNVNLKMEQVRYIL